MAASLLEENLRHLHESLTGDAAQKEQSISIVSDIQQICLQDVTEKEIDLTCSTLFDKDYGLVKYLSKAVSNDELQVCKVRVLELLSDFLEKVGKKILPYAVDIKDVCVSLFSRDRYAKVKNAAMPVLSRLLELTVGSSLGKELQVEKLIEKFFNELTKAASKLTPTVREKIFILLGVIAEVYPEYMTQYAERLIDVYLGALKTEMNSKTRKPELSVIAGCLEGLNCCLVHFTAEEGSKNSYEIFKYARSAIDPKIELTRYDMPRSALKLFTRHASQFNQYLIEDYENIYRKLSYWSHHKNNELLLLGIRAMESFLTQAESINLDKLMFNISEMLKEKADTDASLEGKKIFMFFVSQFRDMMHNEYATAKELSLAIKGYGVLAGPCRCYLETKDVQFMFVEMLTKTEQQFVGQTEDLENKLHNLASYLESLASIVREMSTLSESYAMSLEYLMVLLLENMPNIHPSKHFLCHRAILWLLLSLMPKGTTFKQVLSGFVFQSLIRTCSYLPVIETENEGEVTPDDPMTKKVTYRDFMETWSGLLDAPLIKDFAAADISLEMRHQLTDALYNEIITSVLKILDKLDLSSNPEDTQTQNLDASTSTDDDSGVASADPLTGVQARKPKDFQVFINLVDFCRDLLPTKHFEKFELWVFPFTHKLVFMSTDNPLASGFYKLLSVCMKIANKLNYFEHMSCTVEPAAVKEESESMETETTGCVGHAQKYSCYLLVKKFSKEVLVRMKQYRDDLLASCLTLILSLPNEVIIDQMTEVVPAIQVTLNLGLSYLPLAMVAMDALELWSRSLPVHVMSPHYAEILPCLDSFLKTSDQGAEDVNVDSTVSTSKSKSGKGRKKLSVRLIKGKKDNNPQNYQSQLGKMKERVMQYLGSLGGSVNSALLSKADDEISKVAISWDSHKHLKFDMPFMDMKPTIYLDSFLPRVVELATTSSDRQTKVAACELLHSLVIYSIGRGAQQPGGRVERMSMAALFKNIFPAILKLSCDVEQVAKQLFEPLTMQIIHWFTGNKKSESDETMSLLDAIYDGMIQQSDTGLRDFSARCLHEFLRWSIKQTSAKMSETNPANAKSVLKRLFSHALHPSPFKRLGAALAFNNIYTVFREEEPLVDMFTFQLLVHFVESLAIAHNDEKSLGTQEQCSKALEHIEKIIKYKAPLLKAPSKTRVKIRTWNKMTLEIAIRWLTRQCGRPQTECRHACMKLSYQLCTLLGGVKTPVKFFQKCLEGKGPGYWIERFEGGGRLGVEKYGIVGYPRLVDMADTFSLQTTLSWFDHLLASLDCYTWVFGESLLSPAEMFGKNVADADKTHIFISLEYFLKNISMVTIEGVAKLFSKKSLIEMFSPKEKDDFNRAKCTVIVRMFSFLTIMLAKFNKDTQNVTPQTLWGPELWELMLSCVVQPGKIGFNLGDVDIMKNLPKEMAQTLQVFSSPFKSEMVKHFFKSLSGERNMMAVLPVAFDDNSVDHVSMEQIFSGYLQLHDVNLLVPSLPGKSGARYAQQLLDNVFNGIISKTTGDLSVVSLTPTAHSLAKVMLKLAFCLGLNRDEVLERILDPTFVICGSSKSSAQTHGDLFFSTFKTTISWHCATSAADIVPVLVRKAGSEPNRVCAMLTGTVDFVTRDRELRKKEGPKVLESILSHWSSLSDWWGKSSTTDQQSMALMLVTKLLLIDSKFASCPDHKCFDHVFTMYGNMLTDAKTSLSFKCRVLELLPFFASVPEPRTARLKSSLDRLVADCFPLRSSELTKGSPKYCDYIAAVDRILSGFQLSSSLMLLEYLISIFCREPQHVHEDAIQSAIAKFARRLPRDKQKAALDVPYNIFIKMSYPSEIRRATIERVCLSMLRLVSKSVVVEFFVDYIVQLKDLVEAKLTKSQEAVFEGQLITRIGCFQLLEAMYSRLSKDDVVGMTSAINKAFCDGNAQSGKELTSFISKQAHEAKGEDIRGETTLLELRRQYHCAAYNLMVAFISRTQTDVKFYTAFLFEEKENKGQFLLENLIDKERVYEFQVELQSPLERKKRFVTIHQEVKERKRDEEDNSSSEQSSSFHLASQYLADSSLSEDVSQYFSMSGTLGSISGTNVRKGRNQRASSNPEEDPDVQVTVEDDYVELEMDALNQHECMATMIAVIKHMHENKITPEVKPGTSNPAMPSWMEKLHSKLCDSKTHQNIKLFIAKLVMNTAKVFQPYASQWLNPLIQLIVSGPLGSGTINYFITDLVVLLLSWNKTAIPQDTAEDKALASRLVHFIVKNIYHETRPVFRNNLEMLKTLLECWKGRVDIPYQEIYGQFSSADMKSNANIVGIQVLGVVIACKFPPYGPVAPVDRERFFAKLANNMGHVYKTIYAPAAEVCGMIFQYLADKEDEKEGAFHTHVANLMTSLHQAKPDNFITCVHRMQKHYTIIADRFTNKLLFMLPNLHGEFRTLCLEVLQARVDHIENVFLELKSKGLMTCLTHRDEATQQVALKIVKAILPKLKPEELGLLMPLVVAFSSNPSTSCRSIMYEILMWVYDNYRDEDSADAHKIILQTKECLLKGLGDDDLHSRLQVQNFWSSETRLPGPTLDRLVAMLEAMYSSVTEQQYLSYATNLLLEMTSKSPDYQREIFELPLSECKFSDYAVKSSWRQRHAAMTPLFATLSTQADMEVEDSMDGGVRATQDVQQFSQTQDPGAHKGPFNWLTQSSLDTYADTSFVTMETQNTSSSLLFTLGTADSQGQVARRPKPGAGFGKQRLKSKPSTPSGGKKEEVEEGSELYRLKRRFLKDQEQSRVYFAKRQTRIKQMREIAQQEQKVRRENQVTMYRKYRAGDLPDIQIKYSYIIAPLQALAHRDSTVAKLLLSAIFQAIFAKMEEVKTERDMMETINQINKSLDNILSQSTQYYPPFIGCILDILYNLRSQLTVDVSSLGSSAVFSKLQPLGITVLEEKLIIHEPADTRATKRGKMDTPISKDVAQWIELSRLYKSINEYDVLLGIFSGKIGTQSITQKAVQAESRADYSTAQKLYAEAIDTEEWPGESPISAELDLWEDCRMECLTHLSQWDTLETVSSSAVFEDETTDLTKVWEDTYLQEHFLPYILKSKVKLMLLGDEHQQSLLNFVDASMRVPDQKLILENSYSEQLALMYLWQEDYDRARHYCKTALTFFLQEWSSTDTLMTNSRASALQKLQPLIEMQEFLHFMSEENNFRTLGPSQALVKSWNRRTPHFLTDPVTIWDDVVTNRSVYLDHISSKLQRLDDSQNSMDDDSEDVFLTTKLKLKLQMAASSKEQNNFSLTFKILKETNSPCKKADDESLICNWTHLYTATHHKKIQTSLEPWSEDSLNSLCTTLDQLGKIEKSDALASCSSLGRQHHILGGQGRELLALGLQEMDTRSLEGSKVAQKLLDYTGMKKLKKNELTEKFISDGYQKMKASLGIEDVTSTEVTNGYSQNEAYLATAKYCDSLLRLKEDGELKIDDGCMKAFPETVVVCLLKAMKLDSMEARQRFPRLLQIVEIYPDTMATVVSKSVEVPCWMFILWISQMLAILDKPEARAVHTILEQIATQYPQAVVYPMKLSQEGYKFGTSKQDKLNQSVVDRINSLLGPDRVPMAEKFIAALECFNQPDQEFKDAFDEMIKHLKKKQKDKALEIYNTLYRRLLDYKKREEEEAKARKPKKSQSSQGSQRSQRSAKGDSSEGTELEEEEDESIVMCDTLLDIGSYARKFADEFKAKFDQEFGSNGQKLGGMSAKEFSDIKEELVRLLNKQVNGSDGKPGKLYPPEKLSEYSSWMVDFNPNYYTKNLEIPGKQLHMECCGETSLTVLDSRGSIQPTYILLPPLISAIEGQYTGLCKPIPEYHVKIVGFDQKMKVMISIRKPKRVTIRGNDEKDYHFLVKGGEDLRQDQRIEQLFFIMNQVFDKDPACRNRKLKLRTYQVIPMTSRVGLIEWVSNTISLKDFILSSLTEQEKKAFLSSHGPKDVHCEWITKACKEKEASWPQKYVSMYSKYSYTETQRQLSITESKVPWDLFRRSFQTLSTSPEAFHVLRSHCMKTHAMLSICQYILGIGDRHQSNFMVNLKTGEMVGIDFGHAFGSATQFLGIPELMPFRLTRQFRNLMLPLQDKGLIECTMTHVLRALRSDTDLLLNTMDIFVKEPSLDWLQNADRQIQSMRSEDLDLQEEDVSVWYPKEKIAYVKRKLKGANPAYITRDELKLGHGKKDSYKDFEKVVLGDKDTNIRAQLPDHGLTVEQQVAALIDQATDPNILGRTWVGWDPWV